MWSMGITSRGRGCVAGSLPVVWFGIWFMLVSANSLCLIVFVTGDARQLYGHEIARPPPADTKAPPVYSLALVPNDAESTYSFSRKASTTSNLLPLVNTPTLPQPRPSYHSLVRLSSRRGSEPTTRLVSECAEREGQHDKIPDSTVKVEYQLPPARRTKNLPRASLAIDVEQANEPGPRIGTWDTKEYGGGVTKAFEEDSPGPYLFAEADPPPAPANIVMAFAELNGEPAQPHVNSGSSPEPLAPLVQVPEYAVQRRRTLLELFSTESNGSRRGSKASEVERVRKQWPWPRRLFGPMTLVHSPLVRRAHWAVAMRSAIVASVITCGLTIGLVR
ncbi:unnamed protein product [Rhizoctonia solani]|uniref:Uncharacterized protein n=1 Tax=Rhizoctonia solani TaxID=456999 RepID=A0A8H2XCQ7_9AGAM|nr:unnamed protein product [Rhizoctonia solani]